MEDNGLGLWGVAIMDQIAAAVQADDWPTVARLGVDGWLHSAGLQHPDGSEVTLEEACASFAKVRYENVVLICAEAMRRLYNQGLPK